MSAIDNVYGVLFEPVNTFRYLKDNKPYGQAILLLVLVLMVTTVFQTAQLKNNAAIMPEKFGEGIIVFTIMSAVMSLLSIFFLSGFVSLLSEIFWEKANAGGVLTATCFASIPAVLAPPLAYAATITGLEWIGIILSLLIAGWVFILQLLGIREALEISTGQAVLLIFMPLIILVFILICMVVLFAATYNGL
ncbi:MAG: YIP1 family protein [Syntrophomonadaceae bacterium]|nr:YIP1 family protein [Syntrophomonadaceae bacterium]